MHSNSPATLWSVVFLVVVLLQQLTDTAELSKMIRRQQSQEPCGEMNGKWIDSMWSAYKAKFDRTYDPSEDSLRKQLFASNVWLQAKHNVELDLGLHSYEMGLNDFSDWTEDELDVLYGGVGQLSDVHRRSSANE